MRVRPPGAMTSVVARTDAPRLPVLGFPMIFLPSSCEHCQTIALISCAARVTGRESCASCGGPMSVLPVAAYPEGDVLLFNELLALSGDANIVGPEAEQLAVAIESARSTFDENEALSVAAFRLPGLGPLTPLLVASPRRARQALSMLDTILRALGKTQRPSGIVCRPAAQAGVMAETGRADWQEVGPRSRTWRDDGRGG